MKRGLACLASRCLLLPGLLLAAEAKPFSRVALMLPACGLPGLSAADVRDAVALELQSEALMLAPAGQLSPATDVLVRVAADCAGSSELTLHAEHADERHERRVDLNELEQKQRARALSLALAELLSAFTGQPRAAPSVPVAAEPPAVAPAVPPASASQPTMPPPPPPPLVRAPDATPRRDTGAGADLPLKDAPPSWRLGLAAQLRAFDGSQLWGGRLYGRHGPWIGGADVLANNRSVVAGDVTPVLVHLSLARETTLAGSSDGTQLEAGPRLGAGAAIFLVDEAPTARGADALDAYFDAALAARFSFKPWSTWRLGIAAELGYARGPVGHADGVEVTRTAGPFASLLLDAALQP